MCYMFPKLVSPPITLSFLLIDRQTNGGENSIPAEPAERSRICKWAAASDLSDILEMRALNDSPLRYCLLISVVKATASLPWRLMEQVDGGARTCH